jgi:hypothetical protein
VSASGAAERESKVDIDTGAVAGADADVDPDPDNDEEVEEVEGALADGSVRTRRIRFKVVMAGVLANSFPSILLMT